MEKFIPYEKLSKKGSNPTAAGGGSREGSEWQRSARCKSALPDAASAGHRKPDHFFSPGKSRGVLLVICILYFQTNQCIIKN